MKRSLRSWLWRVPVDEEVEEELAFHIDMRTRELVERGIDPTTARERALAMAGDLARVKRTCIDVGRKRDREMRLTQWLGEIRDDVKFATRQLRRSPTFTLVATITLALGIGANSAIFALADAALLRPLPFDAPPDRLVMVWDRRPNGFRTMAAPMEFREWSAQNRTFETMAALAQGSQTMIGPDGMAEQIPSQTVTTRFFDVLGVRPIAGRTFVPSDATPAPNVVVISEGFWRRRFAADPSTIGREIALGGRLSTVIGIVPAPFQMIAPSTAGSVAIGLPTGVWVLAGDGSRAADNAHYVHVIARLKPGVRLEAASSDMAAVAEGIARVFPANHGHSVALEPLREALIGLEVRLTSMVLLGVVGFVLLMCGANIANLLLARMNARARELAVRAALGAGRRRIVAQLLTESLVLAALGGVLGVGIGAAILQAAPSMIPPGLLPNAVTLTFDGRVLMFCAAAATVVGLLFGLAPAWQSTDVLIGPALASGGRTTGRGGRLRSLLVVGEVAAAVLVLSGAGLLLRTWMALASVDRGYRADDVLTAILNLPMPGPGSSPRYRTPDGLRQFFDAVERELERQPGVKRTAWGSALPLAGSWFGQSFDIAGDEAKPEGQKATASYHMISPSYFATLGIPIVMGRDFANGDTTDGAPVCIVSEAFVRQHLGGRQPLGMRILVPLMSFGPPTTVEREIVGVARQVKGRPDEPRELPQIYVPLAQNAWWSASLVVQPNSGPAEALLSTVRAAIARVDHEQPVGLVRTLEGIAWGATSRPRFRAVLVATFGALALTLAMIGVFGVLAYSVQQRTREFGVRIALGASVSDVMRLVVTSAARMTAIGAVVGLAGAGVLSRSIATLLFGVQPLDPTTFIAAAAVLLLTAAVATAVPALRAAHVDPSVTLRSE